MSATPVLSALQQKKCLSSKKNKAKQTIKNILLSPYANYWPLLTENDADYINDILREKLLQIRQPKINVPWQQIKNIAREKRKDFRLKITEKEVGSVNEKHERSGLVFGVNETSKLLEKNDAASILISGNVDPQIMVKHVLDMAVLHEVPVCVIPNLENLLKEKCGISSVCLGLNKSIDAESGYGAINQRINEISSRYLAPVNHVNFNRKKHSLPKDPRMELEEVSVVETCNKDLYLYRKSRMERSFVPEQDQEIVNPAYMEIDSGCLVVENVAQPEWNASISSNYKPLRVKRVINNKDRKGRQAKKKRFCK